MIIRQLNINSLRNKFESLIQQVTGNIDILMVSDATLDNSFPVSLFLIDGYTSPFRLNCDKNGGGIMLFFREDIPCKLLSVENHPVEGFYEESNLRNQMVALLLLQPKWMQN